MQVSSFSRIGSAACFVLLAFAVVRTPAEETSPPSDGVVIYPVPGEKGVSPTFPGRETPDPIPDAKGAPAGYPVTATFPRAAVVKQGKVVLEDADGHDVGLWASAPDRPANPAFARSQQNTICGIAKKPLAAGTTYAVRMTAEVDGAAWSREWKFTTADPEEGAGKAVDALVHRLNDYRKSAGAPRLTAEPELSRPCTAHALYVEKNFNEKELNWNDEDPKLPGATDDGKRVARRSSVYVGAGPGSTADWCVASFITRELTLGAGRTKVGVGAAPHVGGGYVWVIDAQSGEREPGPAEPVLFPSPDEADVPAAYPTGESMVPVPDGDTKARPGYAVTAQFSPGVPVEEPEAKLTDDAGKEVESYVSSPEHPAIKGIPQRAIGLVPKAPLRGGAQYTATFSAKAGGKAWEKSWSFRTAGEAEPAAGAPAAALASLNVYRRRAGLAPVTLDAGLSKGCRLHAVYLVKNTGKPAAQGLGMHEEDASLPGVTPEGKRAGRSSVISIEPDPDGGAAVDGWMATLYHRIPLLNPDLKKIGFGSARLPDEGWVWVLDAGVGR